MKKLVIFDLDGVLINSKEIHFNALNLALADIDEKYIITQEDQGSIFEGLTTKSKLEILTKTKDLPAELHQKVWDKKQYYTSILFLGTGKDKELITLFRILKSSNIHIAVASNSIRKTLDTCLSRLGISEFISLSLSNEDIENPKPAPDIYTKCMDILNCSKENTIIVEDSDIGKLGAKLSGAKLFVVENRNDVNFELIERLVEYFEN